MPDNVHSKLSIEALGGQSRFGGDHDSRITEQDVQSIFQTISDDKNAMISTDVPSNRIEWRDD